MLRRIVLVEEKVRVNRKLGFKQTTDNCHAEAPMARKNALKRTARMFREHMIAGKLYKEMHNGENTTSSALVKTREVALAVAPTVR